MKSYLWTFFYYATLFSILLSFVWFSNSKHPLRMELQHSVFDQFNKMHPRTPRDDVVIVDIDEESLKHLGQWPWPRKTLAKLVDSLTEKGATVIAFDGVFSEEDRTSPHFYLDHLSDLGVGNIQKDALQNSAEYNYDEIFADAIKRSKIFVTAFTYGSEKPLDKRRLLARSDVKEEFVQNASIFTGAAVNLKSFAKNAAGNGSFMARPDSDGVLRRAGMVFTDGKNLYPSLSLEALRVALAGKKGMAYLAKTAESEKNEIDTNYRILLNDKTLKVPVESDGILYVYYRHFCNAQDIKNPHLLCQQQDYISAYTFLSEEHKDMSRKAVDGKIVLIGASAEGLKDLRNTPLRSFRPGVEVHANVVEQILSQDYLFRPLITKGVEATFIIVVGMSFIILSAFTGMIISVLLCSVLIATAVFGAYLMYVEYGLLLDPIYPSLCVLAIFILSTILSYMRAEAKRKQIRGAFGMYVAPDVMRDLEENPEKLRLGGENRNITVMFTDIRKFTTISEGLSPEELINLMNEFLTTMTDVVLEHKGTVDKYIGDAMMCFWNAPREIENHEREACLAALKMQDSLQPINDKVEKYCREIGKEPVLLRVGIGINSGECAVGNMGSKQRFAYSALGDAVNLSSRLEGLTKQYGTEILIGEQTAEKIEGFAVLEADLVRVVGKTKPERVFILLGDENMATGEGFRIWKASHDEMVSAYRSADFEKAQDALKICRERAGDNGRVLYDLYEQRINEMLKNPPAEEWDGVYIAETK